MLKKRDAQQLSTTIIILMVLGLVALFVLLAIFGKETGRTVKILESCPARGGDCMSQSKCSEDGGRGIPEICPKEKNEVCCIKLKIR